WAELTRKLRLREPPTTYARRYDAAIVQVLRERPLTPLPGVGALISYLEERQIPIGLATQSHAAWVRATLAGLEMTETFDAVVTAEMVARGKPDPELYLRACALLGVEPRRALALEDSLPGVRAARAAEMTVLAVRTPYMDAALELEADGVLARVHELPPCCTSDRAGATNRAC